MSQIITEVQYVVITEQPSTTVEIAEESISIQVLEPAGNILELVNNSNNVTIDNTSTETTVTLTQDHVSVVEIGIQGPEGVVESEIPYAQQVDFEGDTLIYKGHAEVGSNTASSVWRIQKIVFVGTDGDVEITWANGNALFNNIWDNRYSLTYT